MSIYIVDFNSLKDMEEYFASLADILCFYEGLKIGLSSNKIEIDYGIEKSMTELRSLKTKIGMEIMSFRSKSQ
jgi:hypothetical protein